MKNFYVSAESTDWCGVSVDLIVEAPDHYTAEDIEANDNLIAFIDEGMWDMLADDRFDDEENEDSGGWSFATIEETTDPDIIKCEAYDIFTIA